MDRSVVRSKDSLWLELQQTFGDALLSFPQAHLPAFETWKTKDNFTPFIKTRVTEHDRQSIK